jgi:beta-phosphoglucomutase-like phosphatase (HAD superfamily)
MDISLILPPEPYGALIFDCDGTLAHSMPNHYQAWTDTLRSFGADLDEDHFYSMGGVPTPVIIRKLNEQFGYGLDVALTHAKKEHRYTELIHTIKEIEAVANIARANHGKVPMAVASGGIGKVVEATLTTIGLRPLFDAIVTMDDVTNGKPAPDIFLLAAEKLGVAPADCVVYEDAVPGIEGARRAGMRVVDVRQLWGGANYAPV